MNKSDVRSAHAVMDAVYFGDHAATPTSRRVVSGACGALIVATALVLSHGDVQGPVESAFMPIATTLWMFADLITAAILFGQWTLDGNRKLAALSAAYGVSGFLSIPYLATFPGVFRSVFSTAEEQIAIYLWLTWHLTFPVLVGIASSFGGYRVAPMAGKQQRRVRSFTLLASVIAGVLVLTLAAMFAAPVAPALVKHGHFTPMYTHVATPLVLIVTLAAASFLVRKGLRNRSNLDLCLVVALVGSLADIALNMASLGRYSAYWYLGKCDAMIASFLVLGMFTREIMELFPRLEKRRRQTLAFMASASESLFACCLDGNDPVSRLAQLAVDNIGDWCSIAMFDEAGALRVCALEHREPPVRALLDAYHARFPGHVPRGIEMVAASAQGQRFTTAPAGLYASPRHADDATARALDAMIGEGSMMFVPIAADDLVFGVLAVGCAPNGHVYSEDNLTICRSLAERAGTAIAHARRFRREERLAMSLQNASLPRALPRIPRLSLTALYAPGKDEARIGGDWYDVFSLDQGRTLISIGDVGGSGIEAATVMSAARQWVRAAARIDWDPGSILAVVDRTLSSDYPDIYATAFIGVIDHGHGTLAYCSAGHPVPLLRHADGSVEQLGDAGLPLGIRGAGEPGTSTRTLAAGDLLLLYTDGLIEANRDIIEGERRLRRAASSASIAAGSDPARALHELIVPDGASDDLTILAIKLDDASSAVPTAEPRSLSFASEIAAQHASWRCYSSDEASARSIRRELARFLEHHGASDEDLFNAEAVCGELLANVHEHACGPLDVELSWSGSSPVLHVMDRGPGFHWTAGPRQDAWQQQGRGLYLVSKLTQNFSVEARDGGRGAHCRAVLGFRRSEHLPAFAELSATDSILNRV